MRNLDGVKLGSFWYTVMAESGRNVGAALNELPTMTNVYTELRGAVGWMAGNTDRTLQSVVWSIHQADVAQIGPDLQQRIRDTALVSGGALQVSCRPRVAALVGGYVTTVNGAFALRTENYEFLIAEDPAPVQPFLPRSTPQYLLPFDTDLIPSVIVTATRDLTLGLDFRLGDRCLLLEESPATLFPDNIMLIRTAATRRRAVLSYTWGVDELYSSGRYVAAYLRQSQSLRAFELAVAEVAGAVILPWDSTLLGHTGNFYTFEAGVLEVPYTHTPLTVGASYEAGHIVGGVVKLYAGYQGDWFRQVSWASGLSLDTLTPFQGVTFPDRLCRAYEQGTTDIEGDTLSNIRIDVDGTTEAQDAFWAHVMASEKTAGWFLNTVVGLLAPAAQIAILTTSYSSPVAWYWTATYQLADFTSRTDVYIVDTANGIDVNVSGMDAATAALAVATAYGMPYSAIADTSVTDDTISFSQNGNVTPMPEITAVTGCTFTPTNAGGGDVGTYDHYQSWTLYDTDNNGSTEFTYTTNRRTGGGWVGPQEALIPGDMATAIASDINALCTFAAAVADGADVIVIWNDVGRVASAPTLDGDTVTIATLGCGTEVLVNPLELAFQYFLTGRAILVHLDSALGAGVDSAKAFIDRERPIGKLPIYL